MSHKNYKFVLVHTDAEMLPPPKFGRGNTGRQAPINPPPFATDDELSVVTPVRPKTTNVTR